MWFEQLTGFREAGVAVVAARFELDGERLTSKVNGQRMRHGRFEIPSLAELRERRARADLPGTLRVREVVADVQALHRAPESAGALFQVASQFNTLEMASSSVTPEHGIDRYENDHTQGPACAIACGAGTVYRNYFVPLEGGIGQRNDRQINCLAGLAAQLRIDIEMRNGYAFPSTEQLDDIAAFLACLDERQRDALMAHLQIGLQWDTEVTIADTAHTVTQAYCSALPIGYADHRATNWEPFARLVLDGAYEATFAAAVLNADRTGNHALYLTLLGGGVFKNERSWIVDAIRRSIRLYAGVDLDVVIVSYGASNRDVQRLIGSVP